MNDTTTTATIADLAAEFGMEPYAVAAALDLGTLSQHAEIPVDDAAEYRQILQIMADQAEASRA